AFPGQRHRAAALVGVPALEIAAELAAPREPHVLACVFKIVRVDELLGATSDQLVGLVAENGERARADAQERAAAIDHQDQVERGVEDTLIDRVADLDRVRPRQVTHERRREGRDRLTAARLCHDACWCSSRWCSSARKFAFGIGRARKKPWPRSQPMRWMAWRSVAFSMP